MQRRKLGRNGPEVSAVGLGCMGMSWAYGAPPDRATCIATIHAALDAGIDLLDTGDFYGCGHNESLIAEAIRGRRDKVVIAVKFGLLTDPARGPFAFDARPASVRNYLSYTLQRLGTDHVDIYQPARVDPNVPIEDTVGAIKDLIQSGHVRHLGLSEAGSDTLRRAQGVHPVAMLQIEHSLMSRGIEAEILPTCRELGIGVTAYGVLSRGLLTGRVKADTELRDYRAGLPRFQGENRARNLELVAALEALAGEKQATPAQLALAWALHRGEDVVPLIGARRPEQLAESLAALAIRLEPADLARLEAAVPADAVAGTRYDAHGMRMLDSEARPAA